MRKFFIMMLAAVLAFLLCSCEDAQKPEDIFSSSENSTSEEVSESEPSEENITEKEFFMGSLFTDKNLPKASVETISDDYEVIAVSKEQLSMSDEYREIYDKYLAPINSAMPLYHNFSAKEAPDDIYGYIVYQCRSLDEKVLGIKADYKERADIGDSCWVNGRAVEESIARWFPWKPEDYRQYFKYNEETDEYLIPGFGGGPVFSYLTGYDQRDNILLLFYSFYIDEMEEEQEIFQVYKSGILEIELLDEGWKYLSNEITYDESGYFWKTDDYSFCVDCEKFLYSEEAIYKIADGNTLKRFTISGGLDHDFNADKKLCMVSSVNGLWIYDAEKEELRCLENIPVAEERDYSIAKFWLDGENIVLLCYPYAEITEEDTEESVEAKSGNMIISVVRFDDFCPVQMIDTKMKADFITDPYDKIYPNMAGNLLGAGGIEIFSGYERKTFDIG